MIVTAAIVITVILILGVVASVWQAVRATREAVRATKAEHEQVRLTRQAQAQERAARLRAYASEVSVALQSWEEGSPSRARALLERQRPKPGEEDLRGFEWRYLYGLFRPREIKTLRLEGDEVWASAWSPDGRAIAMGSVSGRLELWDWQAARKLESLTGAGIVYGLAFSPDGSKLAYPIRIEGGTNRLRGVALWDLRAKRVTDRFTTTVPPPPAEGYPFPTFSHNGQFLAYVISHGYWKERGNILICDLTGQGRSFELTNFTAAPNIPDFSKDDHFLATPHQDGSVIVWDLKNRKILERLVGHTSIAFCARFSPDGSKLATAGIDCTVRLWNLRGDSRDYFTLGMHNNTVFALSFSSDGKWLVSASLDHTAKVWNVSERKEAEILRGHDQRVYSASFSPDDRFIMTGCEEGTVKIWPAPEPSSVWREGPNLIENLSSVDEFSADNRWLIAEQDNQTRVLDIPSRETNVLDVVRCRISPDAKTAFGLNTNGQFTIWNLSSHVPELAMTITNRCAFRLDVDLALTADGRTLAGVQTNGDVSIWSLAGNVPQQVFVLTNVAAFNSVDFAPGAHVFAVQSGEDAIAVWNWSEGRQLARLQEGVPPKQIQSYKFSPNGRTFLTTYKDGSARFWETAKWTPEEPLAADAHKRSLIFAFSSDANWLALGRDTETKVKLWDMAKRTVEYLPSGSGPVNCLAFAPEGLTLAVGTRDGWVNLWHLPSRHELFPLKAHRSIVHHAVFSPDGRILATAGADGKLRLWVAPTLAEADATPSERR